ncbi:hypothetical protein [Streptomyces sp. NPDC050507]|uniref:hypothetical protein n=1 Tax=Streptomyces sp. NPDC050507 TaxID=3365619 RepID=UPI003790C832
MTNAIGDKTINVNGTEVPSVVDNGDGTQTWNLSTDEAEAIGRAVLNEVMRGLLDRLKSAPRCEGDCPDCNAVDGILGTAGE